VKVALRLFDKSQLVWRSMILTTLLIALLHLSAAAQTQKPLCPTVHFVAPVYEVNQGQLLKLQVNVTNGDPNASYTYSWSVSDGAITSGQGTDKIEIDTTAAQGATITATVEIGGAPRECSMMRSLTAEVIKKPGGLKVYEGNFVSNADLEKQIDELILARIVTQGNAYIIFYAGRKVPATEIKRLTEVAKARIKKNQVDAALFVIIEGGRRDTTAFELWAAGIGADPPKPNPVK
jgi:hypothetical protein